MAKGSPLFVKGNKLGTGRPKGSENKITVNTRAAYQLFVEGNLPQLQKWMDELEDSAQRLEFMLKFSEYFIPKLARTELTGNGGKDLILKWENGSNNNNSVPAKELGEGAA